MVGLSSPRFLGTSGFAEAGRCSTSEGWNGVGAGGIPKWHHQAMIAQLGGCFTFESFGSFWIIFIPAGCYMGVLATATSLSGASLLLWISYSCYVMSGKSLVSKHCKHCKGASTICSMVTGLCAMPWSEEAKWWRRCWEFIRHLLLQLYLELSNARRRCDYPLWQRRCWDVTGDWGGNSVASKVFRFKHLIAWLQALTGS